MVVELIIEKEKIFSQDFNVFAGEIKEIDESICKLLREKEKDITFSLVWLDKLKNLIKIHEQDLSSIPREKRIEALDMLLKSKKENLNILKRAIDEKHDSLLNDIDRMINDYRDQLKRINEELKGKMNPVNRWWMGYKKGKIEKKHAI